MWKLIEGLIKGSAFASKHPAAQVAAPAVSLSVMESLEGRALLSAVTGNDWIAEVPSPQMSKGALKAYNLEMKSLIAGAAKKKPKVSTLIPNCVGQWSGTYITNARGATGTFSVNFTSQKNGSVTGTFNSPIVGGSAVSTVTVTADRTMRAMIKKNGNQFSLTASVSANGKYLTGRWSLQMKNGAWQTGILTITKP